MAKTLTQNPTSKAKNTPELFDTRYLAADLKGRSVRGGTITIISQGCKFVLQTISTVVLARLLIPADFGLIAMVTAITNFALVFRDLGLSTATVQKAEINHEQVSTLFWINAAIGLMVTLAVIAAAPLVSRFYGEPRLMPIAIALSATFLLGGLAVQHQAMLQRHMRFLAIGLIEIISMAISIAAAIVAAILGAGYWALVIMHISLAIVITLGMWCAFPWKPGLPKRRVGTRSMLRFGGHITGFNIVNYFARNADNILIGKFIGATALGFYSKAYALLMLPITNLRGPMFAVATPALSLLQTEPTKYKTYYEKIVTIVAFLSMPLMVYLAIYAEEVIILILGRQWLPAARIFQVLAIAAFIQPAASTRGLVLISLGQGRRYLIWGVVNAVITVISFIIGIWWGAIGVATAYSAANYLILLPSLWYCYRESPVSLIDFFQAINLPLLASGFMGLVLFIIYRRLEFDNSVISLLCGMGVAVLSYLFVWLLIPGGRIFLGELFSYGRVLIRKRK